MRPTPWYRPGDISVSKPVLWALTTISAGIRGNSPNAPELTADGIVDTLLTEAIEAKWPGLLEHYASRERFDADAIKMVADAVKAKEKHNDRQ